MKRLGQGLCTVLAVVAGAGCSSHPAEPATRVEQPVPASSVASTSCAVPGAQEFTIVPGASRLRIYAYRGGRAAFAGHDHVLTSRDFTGTVDLPDRVDDACFALAFPLDRLVVDDPDLRAETGGVFAEKLDAAAIDGTRAHLLGPDNLDAAHYPVLSVRSRRITGDLPRLVATIDLSLHGQTRSLLVPIEVSVQGEQLHARGALAIRQTDFGVRPYSVLGGLLAVQDEVSIDFDLVATRPNR